MPITAFSRHLPAFLAALGLFAAPLAAQLHLSAPAEQGRAPGTYAGTPFFGSHVDSSDGLLIVAASVAGTAEIFDSFTGNQEGIDLLSVPGVPFNDIVNIWDVAMGPDGPTRKAAVFVGRGSEKPALLVFRRELILGTPLWVYDSSRLVPEGPITGPNNAGKVIWGDGRELAVACSFDQENFEIDVFVYSSVDPGVTELVNGTGTSLSLADAGFNKVLAFDSFPQGDATGYVVSARSLADFTSKVFLFGLDVTAGTFQQFGPTIPSPYSPAESFGESLTASQADGTVFVGTPSVFGSGAVDVFSGSFFLLPGTPIPVNDYAPVATLTPKTSVFDEQFGRALAMSTDGEVLAVAERQNEAWPPLPGIEGNYSGLVRLFRRNGSSFEASGEIIQSQSNPGAFFAEYGVDLDLDGVGADMRLVAGAPGIESVSVTSLAASSWVERDLAPGLAGFGAQVPELCLQAGLYATPGLAPGPLIVGMQDGRPNALTFLILGLFAINAPFKQGVLYPAPDIVLPLSLDADGAVSFTTEWPADAVSAGPYSLPMQFWVQDVDGAQGFAATPGGALVQD